MLFRSHETLKAEQAQLEEKLVDLNDLIDQPTSRAVHIYKQMAELSKRHGNARQSQLIPMPEGLVVHKKEKGDTSEVKQVSRSFFLKIDEKKGIIERVKGPRGATVLADNDKLVVLTEDGFVRKLPPQFKGPISDKPTAITIIKREKEIEHRKYLVVFELGEHLNAVTLNGEDLCRPPANPLFHSRPFQTSRLPGAVPSGRLRQSVADAYRDIQDRAQLRARRAWVQVPCRTSRRLQVPSRSLQDPSGRNTRPVRHRSRHLSVRGMNLDFG